MAITLKLFGVIICDPPWKITSKNAKKGVNLKYDMMDDEDILNMPLETLQEDGYMMLWICNSKRELALKCVKKWGYQIADVLTWVKTTQDN